MVRIVNGEIMPDEPQPQRRRGGPNQANIASMNSQPSNQGSFGQNSFQNSGNNSNDPNQGHTSGQPQQGQSGTMMDSLSRMLGVQERSVTIPAFLNQPPRIIPMIYVILLVLLTLFFGVKGLVGTLLLFFIFNKSNQSAQQQSQEAARQTQPH